MILREIEPFIILPYGKMQDMVFYPSKKELSYYDAIREIAYRELANTIILDNIIKVVVNFWNVIVIHIYPITNVEKSSGRTGQNLIIGFVISKLAFLKNSKDIMDYACDFFEIIRQYSQDERDIPSGFVSNVEMNYKSVLEGIRGLDEKAGKRVIRKYYCCSNNIYRIGKWQTIRKMNKSLQIAKNPTQERLRSVYDIIKKYMWRKKVYYIMVNCPKVDYYVLKNIISISY